ncbi:MAG: WD40/YVTN/BNR-like repeat-containing protein [Armatimonadota bacterium]
MADRTIVYVGTVGQSLWRSLDGGLTFARASVGAPSKCDVRALLVHRDDSRCLHLGTETGLFVSRDGADSWERVPSPMDGMRIWSLAQHPHDRSVLLAGTSPAGLYLSRDGGETWQALDAGMPDRCVNGAPLTPRVTCILIDPEDGTFYAGVEIGGLRRSRDGGETWEALGEGLSSQDVHGLAAVGTGKRVLLATTNNDVNRSDDLGETWTPLRVGEQLPWPYTRACAVPPGETETVWVGAGNGPPGSQGGLYRTPDFGATWERLPLPGVANSTLWNLGFRPSDPRRVYATSILGQFYRTLDGGESWTKLPWEFGEVRAVAWVPGSE